jgi:DNA helicase-2/ATP-dependent DNA helicase PcrA
MKPYRQFLTPSSEVTRIIGPPGCGKTTTLLNIMNEEVEKGAVAFTAYTKAAQREAASRVKNNCVDIRTLHSFAYRAYGVRPRLMQPWHYAEWAKEANLTYEPNEAVAEKTDGYKIIHLYNLARASLQPIKAVLQRENIPTYIVERALKVLAQYKRDTGLMEFEDLLQQDNIEPAHYDVVLIDEAQDLTLSQWRFLFRLFGNAKRWYLAGDDCQAVYVWNGAAPEVFIEMQVQNTVVLDQSYRIPRQVHRLANQVERRIRHKSQKVFAPQDREGLVQWHSSLYSISLRQPGTWLLAARTNHLLKELQNFVIKEGVPSDRTMSKLEGEVSAIRVWERLRQGYMVSNAVANKLRPLLGLPVQQAKGLIGIDDIAPERKEQFWYKAFTHMDSMNRQYLRACRTNGESLSNPRVTISTIHGVKGREYDHVVLLTDATWRTNENFRIHPDEELRIVYVGVTRAREALHLINPQAQFSIPIR